MFLRCSASIGVSPFSISNIVLQLISECLFVLSAISIIKASSLYVSGDSLKLLPTICTNKLFDFVGLANIKESILGMSNPVVHIPTFVITFISPFLNLLNTFSLSFLSRVESIDMAFIPLFLNSLAKSFECSIDVANTIVCFLSVHFSL